MVENQLYESAVILAIARDALTLQEGGADLVLLPFVDAANEAADRLLSDASAKAQASAPEDDRQRS